MKLAESAPNPWNEDHPVSYAEMWIGSQECQRTIQRKISGDENTHWLTYAMNQYMGAALGRSASSKERSAYRCLLLGSNEGYMERSLCEHGFTGEIVASDIATKALERARAKAEALGYHNVTYVPADLNRDSFEGQFDFIIAEGVLHHIGNLEACLKMLESRLTPDGKLIMVEFEGAVRFQLPDLQVRWINAALAVLPKSLRPFARDAEGHFPASAKENGAIHYVRPDERAIIQFDPSEALSGPELKRLIPQIFTIKERKGFGGTLLSYMTGHFDFKRANSDAFANSWLKILIELENTVIQNGILDDDFVFYVLEKKAGSPAAASAAPAQTSTQEEPVMPKMNELRQYQQTPVPDLSYASVRDFCDSADHLADIMLFNGDMKDVQRTWAVKAVLGRVPPGSKLLEIGGGEPIVANALQKLGYDVTIIDPYDGSGNGPRDYEQYVRSYPKVKILRARFEKDSPLLAGKTYGGIYSISVLEHLTSEALPDLFSGIQAHLQPGGCSMHCIDHVVAGPTADWHHAKILEILFWQNKLREPQANDQELHDRVSREMDKYFETMAADIETYYLSALGHNVWRGGRPYDEFPFRRVSSVQTVACRPA